MAATVNLSGEMEDEVLMEWNAGKSGCGSSTLLSTRGGVACYWTRAGIPTYPESATIAIDMDRTQPQLVVGLE